MATKEKDKTCGKCKFWRETWHGALGECELELETKAKYHEACVWFEPKGES